MRMYLLRRYMNPNSETSGNRTLPILLAATAPIALMNAWMLPEGAFWITTAFSATAITSVSQRPSAYEAALPISGRDIAIARLVSSFGLSVVSLLLTAMVVALHSPEKFASLQFFQCIAIVALGNLLPRLVRPREFTIQTGETLYPLIALAVTATAMIYWLPSWLSLALLAACAAVAGAVWWRVVPETFQAASHAVSARRTRTVSTSTASAGGFLRTCTIIGRTMYSKHRLFRGVMAILAGALGQWLIALSVMLSVDDLWLNSNWTRALPFSHRARLWMILVPGLLLPFALILLGTRLDLPYLHSPNSLQRSAIPTGREESYYNSPTEISLDYWVKMSDTGVPAITAPWGETTQPYELHLFGSTYYNPYTVRRRNSEPFGNWQFQRLTKAVFGFAMTRQVYRAMNPPPRRITAQARMMMLNVSTGMTFLLLYFGIMWISKYARPWAQRMQTTLVTVAVSLIPLCFIFYAAFVTGSIDAMFSLVQQQLMHLSDVLPRNNVIVFFVALIPVAAAYALLEWQFARSELVASPAWIRSQRTR